MGDNGGVSSWSAPVAAEPVDAVVTLPGSKSLTGRALVLAALAEGPSRLTGVLRSRDTDLMVAALVALGARIEGPEGAVPGPEETTLVVTPGELRGGDVDCGLAGTVMRFVPPVAALARGRSTFDGDAAARVRPQSTMLAALRELGARVEGDTLPFTVEGTGSLAGGHVGLDASASSQFVSGLLLAAARFERGLDLSHTGSSPVPSGPHVEMTLAMLRESGVEVTTPTASSWHVSPGPIRAVDRVVEPDLSNAAAFLAAAAVTGGTVRVPHWPVRTTQPGDEIRGILAAMGAEVRLEAGETDAARTLAVTGPARLAALDLDLSGAGELAPTVAALCARADGTSRLRGIAHLRGHETDRLAALAAELGRAGCRVTELDDGLEITPGPAPEGPIAWGAYADHRMATAGAILGLVTPGIEVDDVASTSKTLPGFPALWARMLGAHQSPTGTTAGADAGPRG